MTHTVDYRVVTNSDVTCLEREVVQLLQEGYTLGPFIAFCPHGRAEYVQVMVKNEETVGSAA